MVVSSDPEKTLSDEATRARTAPVWPSSVPRNSKLTVSHTCHPRGQNTRGQNRRGYAGDLRLRH
jgi:hypothetical protein